MLAFSNGHSLKAVYQKKYLNILECHPFLILVYSLLLLHIYQNDVNNEQVVTIISVSVALVTFLGVILHSCFAHCSTVFRFIAKFSCRLRVSLIVKKIMYNSNLGNQHPSDKCV